MGAQTANKRPKGISIVKEIMEQSNQNENKILNCIVIGDEMMVHYAEPETNVQSKQWKRAGSPPPKLLSWTIAGSF